MAGAIMRRTIRQVKERTKQGWRQYRVLLARETLLTWQRELELPQRRKEVGERLASGGLAGKLANSLARLGICWQKTLTGVPEKLKQVAPGIASCLLKHVYVPLARLGICWQKTLTGVPEKLEQVAPGIASCLLKHVYVPTVIIPVLFALAIGISVPTATNAVLGFLAVLAVTWMGCSLSLMSIVDERDVLEHERLSFLGLLPYILAKLTILCGLVATQTLTFMVVPCRALAIVDRDQWSHYVRLIHYSGLTWIVIGAFVTLLLIGVVAVCLGMLIWRWCDPADKWRISSCRW